LNGKIISFSYFIELQNKEELFFDNQKIENSDNVKILKKYIQIIKNEQEHDILRKYSSNDR